MRKLKKGFLFAVYTIALFAVGILAGAIGYRTRVKRNSGRIKEQLDSIKNGVGIIDNGATGIRSGIDTGRDGATGIGDGLDDIEDRLEQSRDGAEHIRDGIGNGRDGLEIVESGITGIDKAVLLLGKLIIDLESVDGVDGVT